MPPRTLGELQQRERIAACLGDDPVADALIEPPRDDGREQRAGVLVIQAGEHQLREAREPTIRAGLARCEHDRNRLSQETPSDEPEDLERGVVEPLRVVDEAEQRLLLRDLREEGERPESYKEAIGRVPGREAERDAQSTLLGLRKTIELAEHRRAELMEASKWELHLGLDPGDLRDPESGGPVSDIPQQRRFSDARFAPDDQDGAAAVARVFQESVERFTLAVSVAKPPKGLGRHPA